jgi:hypothetical protein
MVGTDLLADLTQPSRRPRGVRRLLYSVVRIPFRARLCIFVFSVATGLSASPLSVYYPLICWAANPLHIQLSESLYCWWPNLSFRYKNKQTPWSESANELYRPRDRTLSAKWLPTFADRGCHVVSVTDPYGRILGFLDRSRYFSIK